MTPAQLETYQRLISNSSYHWAVYEENDQIITYLATVIRLFIKIYPDGTFEQYTEAYKNAVERAMI